MPNTADTQLDRREAIRRILRFGPAATQASLVDALTAQGFVATQSSVSRDLKDIGTIKTDLGYQLADASVSGHDEVAKVADLFRELKSAGPNLLVVKTAIGAAQRVALALDRCEWPEIVGNVGGDDTVFTATPDLSSQRSLVTKLHNATQRAGR